MIGLIDFPCTKTNAIPAQAGMARMARRSIQISTISKSALETPQSGHSQLSGISFQRVPAAMPSSGMPTFSS
jgi:hypothetical protein